MPTTRTLTAALLTIAVTVFAASCANRPPNAAQQFPRSADLAVEPEPVLSVDALASDQAANDYDNAVLGWGRRGWLAVGRVCRWAADNGMEIDCPAP